MIYGMLMWGAGQSVGLAVLSKEQYDHQLTLQWVQFTLLNLFSLPWFNEIQ